MSGPAGDHPSGWRGIVARQRRPTMLVPALVVVFFQVVVLLWVAATPVGGVPDERAHAVYAWGVATGQALSEPAGAMPTASEDAPTGDAVPQVPTVRMTVPAEMLRMIDHRCYAFDASVPATDCGGDLADVEPGTKQVAATTYMARYPTAYYLPMGAVLVASHAAGLDGPTALLLARAVSGTWTVLLLGLAALALSTRLPGQVVLSGSLLAVAPMALFVSSALNPNGLEVAAAMLVAAGVVVVRLDAADGRRPAAEGLVALAVGVPLLALVRPLSVAWLGLLLLALLVPTRSAARRVLPAARLPWWLSAWSAVWLAVGLGWLVWSTLGRDIRFGEGVAAVWAAVPPGERVVLIALRYSGIVLDAVGTFGWLDTPLPSGAVVAWLVAVVAMLTALALLQPGRRTGELVVGGLVLVGGLAAVFAHTYLTGFGWQPRYVLPVLAAALVVSLGGAGDLRAGRLLTVCGLVAVLVHAASPLWTYGRFRWGFVQDSKYFPPAPLPRPLPSDTAWEPLLGPSLMASAGSVAVVVGVVALVTAHRAGRAAAQWPRSSTSSRYRP